MAYMIRKTVDNPGWIVWHETDDARSIHIGHWRTLKEARLTARVLAGWRESVSVERDKRKSR